MENLLTEANRARFLTVRWNNRLAAGLALPGLIFIAVVLFTTAFSDRAAFIGMAVIGAFY